MNVSLERYREMTRRIAELERERDEARGDYEGLLNRESERIVQLASERDSLREQVEEARIILRRADNHEFKGTTAENGDAHALVKQASAVLDRAPNPTPGESDDQLDKHREQFDELFGNPVSRFQGFLNRKKR